MKNLKLLDVYSDYLLVTFGQATATGISAMLQQEISHDQVQRGLAGEAQTSADLWRMVKPHVRQIEKPHGILVIDDSISEKPSTDENELICWHYDHTKGISVKGINFVSCLYHCDGISFPVGFELVKKIEHYIDKKTGKHKRRSKRTKNQMYRDLLSVAIMNHIQFKYVTNDSWFSSAENIVYVKQTLSKDVVMPLKTNRKVALSLEDKRKGRYQRVDTLKLEEMQPVIVYLESVSFPLSLVKQVFTNKDGSTGILYLICSDTTLTALEITTIYQKRWNVECYHKSLKQNVALEKSPTQTVNTQTNHFFAALCGYIKLELLKLDTKLNHFALKSKLYLRAVQSAYESLRELRPARFGA